MASRTNEAPERGTEHRAVCVEEKGNEQKIFSSVCTFV